MKHYSTYYVPRTKTELVKAILPTWKGKKTELRQMSTQRLRAIFHRMRQELIGKITRGDYD